MGFALALIVLAGITSLVAWIWLVVIAFRKGLTGWGIALIIGFFIPFGPLAALVFTFVHPGDSKVPRNLLLAAFALGLVGGGLFVSATKNAIESSPEFREVQQQMQRAGEEQAGGANRAETAPPAPEPAAPPPPPPAPPRRQTPSRPEPAPASTETIASTETARPPAKPVSVVCPVQVELVNLGAAGAGQMRPLELRMTNSAPQAVTEVKLGLDYLDARGRRIGGRSTVHSGDGPLAGAGKTGTFTMTAFQVPEFTTDVRIRVEAVSFADRSRWPDEL